MTDQATSADDAAPQSKLTGRLLVVLTGIMWSSSGLFAKGPIFDVWPEEVRGTLMAFWRAFFAAMILLPLVRRPRWRLHLLPLGLCFTLMNVSYLTAMSQTTAANAIWLQNTCPWWVFLISVLVLRDPVVRRDLIPLVFGVAGVGTILAFEARGQAQFGVLCGLVAGVTYAGVVVLMRQLRNENASWLIALNHAVVVVVLLPWILHMGHWPSIKQLLVLAAFGSLQMAIPYVFLVRGLRSISSQEAVAIGMIEPILVPVWAFLVRGEKPAWWTIAGAALIFTGLVLRYVVWELWSRRGAADGGGNPPRK